MLTYFYDLETDGLRDEATKIHIGVFKNKDDRTDVRIFLEHEMDEMVEFLGGVDMLISHNGIGYDQPVMDRLLGFKWKGKSYDTLVLSRILSPNRMKPFGMYPTRAGPHSVEVWAYRLGGVAKVENEDWSVYTENMRQRCIVDVNLQEDIYYALQDEMKDGDWSRAVPMSMKLFEVFDEIEQYGWYVDQDLMHRHLDTLDKELIGIDNYVNPLLPLVREDNGEIKKPFLKAGGYTKAMLKWYEDTSGSPELASARADVREVGGPFCRIEYRRVDITKRVEIIKVLMDEGWIPDEWNVNKDTKEPTSPKLSMSDSFTGIAGDMGKEVARRVQVRHRKSLIEGLFKLIRPDGRIGSRITGLADTSRVKHSGIVNIPNGDAFFGKEIRQIFSHSKGMTLVGVDSAGNQVRQLCAKMGDDAYEYEVLHGDVHTANQEAAGLPTRSNAKTFFYGFLFGAGDAKIGSIVNGNAAEGKRLKANFLEGLPLLRDLIDRLTTEWRSHARKRYNKKWDKMEYSHGWVAGLDGRPLYIKSEHAVLVYVLQNMEALQMSLALLFTRKWLEDAGLTWGVDYGIVCFYHDEINTECKPEHAQLVGDTVKKAIIYAGEYLKISTPHDADIKIGDDWYAIH